MPIDLSPSYPALSGGAGRGRGGPGAGVATGRRGPVQAVLLGGAERGGREGAHGASPPGQCCQAARFYRGRNPLRQKAGNRAKIGVSDAIDAYPALET